MRIRLFALALTGALTMLAAGATSFSAQAQVSAQAPLSCSPANAGQQVCQAEGVCRCTYSAGGSLLREPAGYRWDCSVLYGKCSAGSQYPVLARGYAPAPGAATGGKLSNAEIRAVQSSLTRLGFDAGPADGVVGPRTRSAVSAYERSSGLPATGQVTPDLAARLGATAQRG